MKARVKATGKIVDVELYYITPRIKTYIDGTQYYNGDELDFNVEYGDPNYWTRLEHTYAGMAMQGILSNGEYLRSLMHTKHDDFRADEVVPSIAVRLSHALVEKMKEVK